ncbi:MAG TPA: metal-dependent hydrolase [Cyclobacteriaceae bacterium]|nr:metal-dependent hydrolase [Cyclobacteriaceae bacterium]
MDSLTQIVLGAAVAEVVAGKKLGNRALLWGAIGGTIPDLDVIGGFFMGEVAYVNFHRGFSHSLVFGFILGPLLGWLVSRSQWSQGQSFWLWTQLFFWTIFTHPLLDSFTSYGTQLFLPFSDYRVELNTIFIIDPAYTLPMLAGLIAVMFLNRQSTVRRNVVFASILLSHVYLLFTIVNKYFIVEPAIKVAMARQNVAVEQYQTIPAPLQNFLWQGIIKTPEGYYAGYFNPWRGTVPFESFLFFERNSTLENELLKFRAYQGLTKFSSNYDWLLKTSDSTYIYNDMRFSTAKGWLEKGADFVFSFDLVVRGEDLEVSRRTPTSRFEWEDLTKIFNRIITD